MNDFGQIGDGRAGAASPVPTVVRGIAGARAASAGGCHTCALLADGRLRCWGRNHHGQIGDGTRLDRAAPVDVLWAR
jgi:alpha-tubulin suppressor-like RCC1 family protein